MIRGLLNKAKNSSLVPLYIIVLIPVLAMVFFLLSEYSYHKEEEIRKNEQMAQVLAENLDSYLANLKAMLKSLTLHPHVQDRNRSEIERIFQSLSMVDEKVYHYWITDINGEIIAMYPNNWRFNTNTKSIKEITEKPIYVSEPQKDTITGLEVITVSTIIYDPSWKRTGVLGVSIPLENLSKGLGLKVGNNGYPTLLTKKGHFLVHPQRETMNTTNMLEDPVLQAALQGQSGTLNIASPMDGDQKFYSYIPLREADWILTVVQPLSEFNAKTARLFTRNGFIILLVFSIVALGGNYLLLFRKREVEAKLMHAEKLSLVGQLAAGMAHEIRNPLTSIKGLAQLAVIREKNFSTDHLNIIVKEADRIESIVKETLMLAKPTPVQFNPINIGEVLEEVCSLMEPEANMKNVSLILAPFEKLPYIMGDINQLKQVFINLIKNSAEAAPDTGGTVIIDVSAMSNSVLVSIKDNGTGIPPEILSKLGSPFVSTKENGTGLGLMVTYRIVHNHNGIINVSTKKMQGTTFTVELPIFKD